MSAIMGDDEKVEWNVDMEVNLFHAIRRHKPVGVNRHFQMACLHEKLNNSISKKVTSKQVWQHLAGMYDLQALNESEILPFPNVQTDFRLPETEYGGLMSIAFPRVIWPSPSPAAEEKETRTTKDNKDSLKEHSKEYIKEHAKEHSKEHTKEHTKEHSQHAGSTKGAVKPSVIEKVAEKVVDNSKAEDSPKREQRKRTRQAIQSPATPSDTTPTTKRPRRT